MGTLVEEALSLIARRSTPLSPVPAELPERLQEYLNRPLPRPARALLFDIYGTLFISGSGDVGSAAERHGDGHLSARARAVAEAFATATSTELPDELARLAADRYEEVIRESHARSRARGVPHPEVDIVTIWEQVLESIERTATNDGPVDLRRLALAYELASNPVWPMPGVRELLEELARTGRPLGIVSNAQFYTPLLFRALLGRSPVQLGIRDELTVFSYREGRAKPDPELFDRPLATLRERGIDSSHVVYLGNDMRNDILAAQRAGCMSILFAGDERSLRVRGDDPRTAELEPDSVIAALDQLPAVALGNHHA